VCSCGSDCLPKIQWKDTAKSVLLAVEIFVCSEFVKMVLVNYRQSYDDYCRSRIICCLVTLELWLPDMYSFVVFLLRQKTNLTIFKRNCFTLVLRILIAIIPAAVLHMQQIIYVAGIIFAVANTNILSKKQNLFQILTATYY